MSVVITVVAPEATYRGPQGRRVDRNNGASHALQFSLDLARLEVDVARHPDVGRASAPSCSVALGAGHAHQVSSTGFALRTRTVPWHSKINFRCALRRSNSGPALHLQKRRRTRDFRGIAGRPGSTWALSPEITRPLRLTRPAIVLR